MKNVIHLMILMVLLSPCPVSGNSDSQEELPDDYLPITLMRIGDRLEGESEFLEGYIICMSLPEKIRNEELSVDAIFRAVRNENISGSVTYPNGKVTDIEYEVVRHRDVDEIYMKSSLGYFLWEFLSVEENRVSFAIYWWYCPPATESDIEILEMAEQLLAATNHWHQDDDRECKNDIQSNQWSLFCALKYSSLETAGEYNHHNTAIQSVRFTIDEVVPDHQFEHTLMDFNNLDSTTHIEILNILESSKKRIENELAEDSTRQD